MKIASLENFEKVENFVKDRITYGSDAYIQSMPYGYKVNGFMIRKFNNYWQLFDNNYAHKHDFSNRKHAVLAAVLLVKNRREEYEWLVTLDKSWQTFDQDKEHFVYLYKTKPMRKVYQDRLDRIDQGLENIQMSISQIEKSVNLQ